MLRVSLKNVKNKVSSETIKYNPNLQNLCIGPKLKVDSTSITNSKPNNYTKMDMANLIQVQKRNIHDS